jgi:hypothetical protein
MSTKPVTTRLDELLAPLGFARHKTTWNRQTGSFVDVIDVQTRKTGGAVTINAGVLHPGVYRKCWATEPPALIEEPLCTVRTRVVLDGKETWWQLNDTRTPDDIGEKVTAYVLPFIERMHSLDAMEQFLTAAQVMKRRYPPLVVYLAILMNERGDKAGALLTELGKKTIGDWKPRISEIAETLDD